MRFTAFPISESSRIPGIGEIVVFSWVLEDIGSLEAWRVEVEVEPPLLDPPKLVLEGRGPAQDLARFVATAAGTASVSFVLNSGIQRGQWPIQVTQEV